MCIAGGPCDARSMELSDENVPGKLLRGAYLHAITYNF